MKRITKELILSSLAAAILAVASFYFLSKLQQEKKAGGNDLFAGVASDCRALLYMKKNTVFSLSPVQPVVDSVFGKILPPVYRSILDNSPRTASFLVAFYPGGSLLYGNLAPGEFSAIRKKLIPVLSNGYSSQRTVYRGNEIEYYPLKNADFLGCYYHDGLFIAGCDKKILERAVDRSRKAASAPAVVPLSLRKELDARVSVYLLLKAEPFGLDLFPRPDSAAADGGWMHADLTWHADELCGFGSVPYPAGLPDSLTCPADTLALRVQCLLPGLRIEARLNEENDRLYYSVCGRLPVSTVSPSNE